MDMLYVHSHVLWFISVILCKILLLPSIVLVFLINIKECFIKCLFELAY